MKIMKPELFLAVLFYLLSSYGPNYVTATSEAEEENEDLVGPTLLPLKLGMSVCAFKADRGPCKAMHTRYHFDIQTRQCEIFNYGGCEGNDNNFLTLEECQEKCIVPELPEMKKRSRLKKEKPSYCLLENDPGICRGLIARYFYNKESQMCEKFQYGGCLGNPNNFHTLKECQDTCEDNFSAFSDNSLQIEEESGATNNRTSVIKQGIFFKCQPPLKRNCWRVIIFNPEFPKEKPFPTTKFCDNRELFKRNISVALPDKC